MVEPPGGAGEALGFNYLLSTYVAPRGRSRRPEERRSTGYGLWMQKRKMRGRVPRSLGSATQRTDGDGGDDVGFVVAAQPARTEASRTRGAIRRFMAIF